MTKPQRVEYTPSEELMDLAREVMEIRAKLSNRELELANSLGKEDVRCSGNLLIKMIARKMMDVTKLRSDSNIAFAEVLAVLEYLQREGGAEVGGRKIQDNDSPIFH